MKNWSKPAAVLTAVLGMTGCGLALAWGAPGHETVGAIADQLIAGTHAQTHVQAILGNDLINCAHLRLICKLSQAWHLAAIP